MTTSSPRIGVVIPAHQAAATVARAVQSVREQTHAPAWVVVVDDGSTDETAQLARAAGATVIRQPNQGAAAARHRGTTEHHADAFAFLDADDTWLPHFLHDATQLLTQRPEVSLVMGRALEARADGTQHLAPMFSDAELAHPLWGLAWHNLVPTSATVVPAWAYRRSGGFDSAFPGAATEDLDLWLRLSSLGPFACTARPGVLRHVQPGSNSRRPEALARMLDLTLWTMARHAERVRERAPWFKHVAMGHAWREGAKRALANGLVGEARTQAAHALRCNPADREAWQVLALTGAPEGTRASLLAWRRHLQDQRARAVTSR
ncbi:MAG: glycosyltransferase family 2 protein [Myxococcota bacterium]